MFGLCPLVGVPVGLVSVFSPGMDRLCVLVGVSIVSAAVFLPGDDPFVFPGWGFPSVQ